MLTLHAAGLVRPAKKRSAHRKKRPRRPVRGMMLHQDGSRHAWLEGQPQLDLIVTMDDATSEILSMFTSVPTLVEQSQLVGIGGEDFLMQIIMKQAIDGGFLE